jgi:proline dehydrogenase
MSTWPFVRRAVTRFMPGEQLSDALAAARDVQRCGIGVVLTRLGENVTDIAEADDTMRHYMSVADTARAHGLDCHISVKLTQLGLDIDPQRCQANLLALADGVQRHGVKLWIDMEQSAYVERTLDMRRALRGYPHAGVCLQAYLRRTADDLRSLLPIGGGIRLVKGAYREPSNVAYPRKRDVDEHYFRLACELLDASTGGVRPVFGTHDRGLIDRIRERADRAAIPRDRYEFHLLYGIERDEQLQLAREGCRVKTLISYGDQWFPWYMRRLAERPANLVFVARAIMPAAFHRIRRRGARAERLP